MKFKLPCCDEPKDYILIAFDPVRITMRVDGGQHFRTYDLSIIEERALINRSEVYSYLFRDEQEIPEESRMKVKCPDCEEVHEFSEVEILPVCVFCRTWEEELIYDERQGIHYCESCGKKNRFIK